MYFLVVSAYSVFALACGKPETFSLYGEDRQIVLSLTQL